MAGENLLQLLWRKAPEEEVLKLIDAASAKEKNSKDGCFPLHYAAQCKASEAVVRSLLDAYPDAVKQRDNDGDLPLHCAAWVQASEAVVAALLGAYPEATAEENNDGDLPVRAAIESKASDAFIAALSRAYPKEAKEKEDLFQRLGRRALEEEVLELVDAASAKEKNSKDGCFPLHYAAQYKASEAVVRSLLNAYPDAVKLKDNVGYLPLHAAAGNQAPDTVVKTLLGANPEAVKEPSNKWKLPLHVAAETKATVDVIKLLLEANREAAKKGDEDNWSLPLHLAAKNEASVDVIKLLLEANPQAVYREEKDGSLPLHGAVDKNASEAVVYALLEADPAAAKVKNALGRLPLVYLLERDTYLDQESILGILANDMPISLEDGSPVKHCHSWTKCLASDKEAAIEAVRHILDPERGGYSKHVNKLIQVRAENKLPAIKVAAPEQEAEINKHRLFCGRYEFYSDALEHRSETSTVLRATDRQEKIDYRAVFDEEDKDNSGTLTKEELVSVSKRVGLSEKLFTCIGESIDFGEFMSVCVRHLGDGYRRVVIKLMKNEEQWKREKSMREEHALDPKYVVGMLEGVPSDEEIRADVEALKGLGAIQEKLPEGIELGKYAIIMEAADRNLLQIYAQEQPNINASQNIFKQLLEAAAHMHLQGVEHGDFKFLNAVRFGRDGRLRITDLDASARILKPGEGGESYTGSKFSSATLPPEMFFEVKTDDHRQQLEEYWRNEDKELRAKVAEKTRKRRGKVTNSYVVKTFRTKEGEPVYAGLPYEGELVEASEKGDIWALGVMAFELLAEQPFVPYDRNNDCASGDGMHMIYNWGNDEAVLEERLEKIKDPGARKFVHRMLQRNPEKRPSVASLLDDDFFKLKGVNAEANAEVLDALKDIQEGQKKQGEEQERQGQELKRQGQEQKRQGKLLEDIKDLSQENQAEIRHTCTVLMKGIFEAAQVTMPATFVILHEKLEEPSAEEEKDLAAFKVDVDGNGVTAENEFVSCQSTEEGLKVNLKGKFKVHQDRFEKGMAWVEDTKEIGSNLSAHKVGDAFEIIKERLSKVMSEKSMYLYLVDELIGEPVRAEGWPIEITKPSEWVHKMVPLMQLGMHAMSLYNGAAGVARMFGCLLPKVPKELSKGARESIALLQMESSVQEFSVVYGESMQGSEEDKSVRGQSLREFKDFLKKHDPKLKKNDGSEGDFAGLQLLGNPNDGTAIWTTLTNKEEIEKKLNERREQRQEEEREREKVFREYLIGRPARKEEERRPKAVPLPSQGAMRQPSSSLTSSPANPQPTEHVATGKILIVIEKGRGFKDKRSKIRKLDVPDVYCKIKYGASEWQTHHVKNDEDPVWSCQQVCEYDPNQLIKIDVFDKNRMRDDDYYGRASLDVSNISNANNGSLELEVKKQYSPNGWTNRWSDGMFITIKFQKLLFLA